MRRRGLKALLVINPGNPTGQLFSLDEMIDFLHRAKDMELVIVDESFIDFAGDPIPSLLPVADQFSNLLLVRSMSKHCGVPGLRLGYCYSGNLFVLNRMRQFIPTWNVNTLAQYFLSLLPSTDAAYHEARKRLIGDVRWLYDALRAISGIEVYPTGANFVLFKIKGGMTAAELQARLLNEHRMYVRDCSNKVGMDNFHIRVASQGPRKRFQAGGSAPDTCSDETPLGSRRHPQNDPQEQVHRLRGRISSRASDPAGDSARDGSGGRRRARVPSGLHGRHEGTSAGRGRRHRAEALPGPAGKSSSTSRRPIRSRTKSRSGSSATRLRKKLPILGICRGSQLLNVVCGGTLYGDVQKEKKSRLKHIDFAHYDTYRHPISIVPGSPLRNGIGAIALRVNSYHHQGIRELGAALQAHGVRGGRAGRGLLRSESRICRGTPVSPRAHAGRSRRQLAHLESVRLRGEVGIRGVFHPCPSSVFRFHFSDRAAALGGSNYLENLVWNSPPAGNLLKTIIASIKIINSKFALKSLPPRQRIMHTLTVRLD